VRTNTHTHTDRYTHRVTHSRAYTRTNHRRVLNQFNAFWANCIFFIYNWITVADGKTLLKLHFSGFFPVPSFSFNPPPLLSLKESSRYSRLNCQPSSLLLVLILALIRFRWIQRSTDSFRILWGSFRDSRGFLPFSWEWDHVMASSWFFSEPSWFLTGLPDVFRRFFFCFFFFNFETKYFWNFIFHGFGRFFVSLLTASRHFRPSFRRFFVSAVA